MTTGVLALPHVMDPMYWLGDGGLFGSAVLPGVILIVFIETGLLCPFLRGDTLLFTAGLIAAQPDAPVDVWTLAPCAAIAAVAGGQLGYLIGWRLGPALFKKEDARFFKKHYLEWMVLAIAVLSTLPVIGSVLRAAAVRRRPVAADTSD